MKKEDWQFLRTEKGENIRIAQMRFNWWKNPRNGAEIKATLLEMRDWVTIVAITPEEKILVVRQFRFGVHQFTTECPAGIMEAGETPQEAAARELAEETGYISNDWHYFGWVEPNSAFQNNRCHLFLAKDAVKRTEIAPDEGEDITFCEMTLGEIKKEIAEGRMRNSLTLLTLTRIFEIWK